VQEGAASGVQRRARTEVRPGGAAKVSRRAAPTVRKGGEAQVQNDPAAKVYTCVHADLLLRGVRPKGRRRRVRRTESPCSEHVWRPEGAGPRVVRRSGWKPSSRQLWLAGVWLTH